MDKIHIKGLHAYEYQHPFDRKALILLQKTMGLSGFIKKISEYGIEAFTRMRLIGSGLRVTSANFPQIHRLLVEACAILDIGTVPDMYLIRGEDTSLTIGVDKPLIALSHTMVDTFSEEELMFMIGHQLSYIKSESLLYQQVATAMNLIAELGTAGPISLMTIPIKIAISRWEKMSHYTADRAGLLCCQDTDAATSVFIKLAGQPEKLYHQIDVDEFRRQAFEFEEFDYNKYNKIVKMLIALDDTHPPYVIRGAEFFKWIKSGDYENILLRKPISDLEQRARCPFCGHPTLGGENFCSNCGNKIPTDKPSCKKCFREIGPEDRFCMHCGTPVEPADVDDELM